jgi:hypothetical protein
MLTWECSTSSSTANGPRTKVVRAASSCICHLCTDRICWLEDIKAFWKSCNQDTHFHEDPVHRNAHMHTHTWRKCLYYFCILFWSSENFIVSHNIDFMSHNWIEFSLFPFYREESIQGSCRRTPTNQHWNWNWTSDFSDGGALVMMPCCLPQCNSLREGGSNLCRARAHPQLSPTFL